MAYTDIITLSEMKDYLRVDQADTGNDDEITGMINAAFIFFENYTNILVIQRSSKKYLVINNCVRVYDYPINDVNTPSSDFTVELKPNYSLYHISNSSLDELDLDVGYSVASDVDDNIKARVKELVKLLYYEQENDKTIEEMLSPQSRIALDQMKRFLM